jgi:hypothetical protein
LSDKMVKLPRADSVLGDGLATASCALRRHHATGASRTIVARCWQDVERRAERRVWGRFRGTHGDNAFNMPPRFCKSPIPGAVTRPEDHDRSLRACSRLDSWTSADSGNHTSVQTPALTAFPSGVCRPAVQPIRRRIAGLSLEARPLAGSRPIRHSACCGASAPNEGSRLFV